MFPDLIILSPSLSYHQQPYTQRYCCLQLHLALFYAFVKYCVNFMSTVYIENVFLLYLYGKSNLNIDEYMLCMGREALNAFSGCSISVLPI